MTHTPAPWFIADDGTIETPRLGRVGFLNHASKADSQLIAAAPSLLEACHKVANNWNDLHPKDLMQLRAAIAKATGEP